MRNLLSSCTSCQSISCSIEWSKRTLNCPAGVTPIMSVGVVFGFDFDGLLDAHSVHPLSAPSAWAQSQEMPALLLCAMQVTRRLSGMVIVQVSHWAL